MSEIKTINTYFQSLFKDARNSITGEITVENAEHLEDLVKVFTTVYDNHKKIINLLGNLKEECKDKAFEIRSELSLDLDKDKKNKFTFVFRGKTGMTWGEMDELETQRNLLMDKSKELEKDLKKSGDPSKEKYKKLTVLDGVELPKEIKVKMVSRLESLPTAFGWYNGDKKHREGIYIRLPKNMFVRVPFPNVIDGTKNYNRSKTIRCKHVTEQQCYDNRKFMADQHGTSVRDCFFAHKGDTYSKVGTNFRCPAIPRIGNHRYLTLDLNDAKSDDIKPLLMNSLSDLLVCYLWNNQQHADDKMIMSDVEIC